MLFLSRKVYIYVSVVILYILAFSKIIDVINGPRALSMRDPLLGVSYAGLLLGVAAVEIVIASVCLIKRASGLAPVYLLVAFSSILAVYRIGLWAVGARQPCSCMGSLGDGLGISMQAADYAAKSILMSMLVFGYFFLIKAKAWRSPV